MTDRQTELTREVERLIQSGINSDRICPSIAMSWPNLTAEERELVAVAFLQVAATAAVRQAVRRH
jgi:hypothetical protein